MSLDVNISEPDEFNCIELHNCIEQVAKLKSIEDFTYHVDLICENGENYVANVFRVLIKETESNKNVSVIVKTFINTTRQELFSELHKREVGAYNKIIAKLYDLQSDINIESRITLPRCILSSIDKGKEVLILEDLLVAGFKIDTKLKAFEKLDYLQVNHVLSELGKFHALSFVWEKMEQNLDNLENLKDDFSDIIFNDSFLSHSDIRKYFLESFEISLSLIEDIAKKQKLANVENKLLDIFKMYTRRRKFNVFCHGDCWINNILFKTEGNRKELCFIDFQAMRYASPVTDILYFLYICTDSKFRSEHFEELKSVYYESLENYLKLFNIEASTVYPKNEFLYEIEDMLPFGLLIALVELRIVTTTEDEFSMKMLAKSEMYNKEDTGEFRLHQMRVSDVVNESEDNGVLDRVMNLAQ